MAMNHETRAHMSRHRDDVDRLVALAASNGHDITPRQAYRAWIAVSERSCAGWLMLDSDDEYLWANAHGAIRDVAA